MRSILAITLAHIVAISLLITVGFALNDTIATYASDYQGVMSVLSLAAGAYSFALTFFYHNNANVYLRVNRVLLFFRRTHTYWLPAFDYRLPEGTPANDSCLYDSIRESLESSEKVSVSRLESPPSTAVLLLDQKLYLKLRVSDGHLFVTLDRKILVPSHLYDRYSTWLARISDVISRESRAEETRLGISITFEDGSENPYFGFFVRRAPFQALRHFEASFDFESRESCRIRALTDSIQIDGDATVDFFGALTQVLSLKAAPSRGMRA